ncbi:GNAT family N-acetyltransferase [Neobacillus niacini]|uniref:GNAT family N-acetyltransferase n=1 Tax=Neobacillus niacini TaxID=86668 RepID=UPI0021CB033A|nr:GNAT family N-acetyltransferase [Neobacillus niacini]MCM3765961.1 GNAT family N-acetyltransferase [Neobacillus niacini]
MSYYFQVIESPLDWELLLKTFNDPDVYYTREYGSLFAKMENGQLRAAFYKDELSKIFYPFIKRKVDWAGEEIYDIVTPYGYGGPLLEGREESIESFYYCFTDYCIENKIITETIRFHPVIRNYEVCKNIMDVDYIRKTTAVDLTAPLDQIKKQYSSMTRRNIKKAQNAGLFCYLADNTPKNIGLFIDMYKETMDRNKADSYFYFSEEYFIQQMKKSNKSETFLLFAQSGSEVIAGVMVMNGPKYSHYHLGASKTSGLHLKPNNLLFDYMIEFCKSKGASLLHLGGGYQENDGLFKFKSSFSNANHLDYYVGKKVYDEKRYCKIVDEVRRSYNVNETYFPIYRAKKELLADSPT